jgi:hypothetical protein
VEEGVLDSRNRVDVGREVEVQAMNATAFEAKSRRLVSLVSEGYVDD